MKKSKKEIDDSEETFLRCVFCHYGTIWQHKKTLELHITCGRKSELDLMLRYDIDPTFKLKFDKPIMFDPVLTNEEIVIVCKGCVAYKRKRLVCDYCHKIIEPKDDWFHRGSETYHKDCMDQYVKDMDSFLDSDEKAFLEKNESDLKQKESEEYQDDVDKLT